jgi:hypothetical protein
VANATSASNAANAILTGQYRGLGVGGGPAFASPYLGPIVVKYINYDVGQLYSTANGTYGRAADPTRTDAQAIGDLDALTTVTPASFKLDPAEDAWGIQVATEIWNDTQTVRLWTAAVSPWELTGMFWGVQDTYLDQTNSTTQEIHSVNFRAAFWVDDSPDFDPTGGPSARTGTASYPTATDGHLFWSMLGLAGAADSNFPADEFFTTFNPSAAPGAPNVGNGSVAGVYGTNAAGTGGANSVFDSSLNGADWSVRFTGVSPTGNVASWAVQSNDPLITTAVPTPAAAYAGLLGLGLLVGSKVWRRVRA